MDTAFTPTENCPYCMPSLEMACFDCYHHNCLAEDAMAGIDAMLTELDELIKAA